MRKTKGFQTDRGKKRGRRGFCFTITLTAGILGMSIGQTMVWAAPKSERTQQQAQELLPGPYGEDNFAAAFPKEQERAEILPQEKQDSKGTDSQVLQQTLSKDEGAKEQEPFLVAIDPGHGGVDSGCVGKKAEEKDINLQIARELEKALIQKGYRVLLLREKDEFQDKMDRVEIANSYQADVYVSIHQNTYEGKDKTVGGIETWYDGTDASRDNQRLALLVHRETVKSTGARGRGVIDSTELYVASKTLMPACLIETGFLSNPQEEKLLASADYQKKLAEGIAQGIELYFHPGIMYVPFEDAPWRISI